MGNNSRFELITGHAPVKEHLNKMFLYNGDSLCDGKRNRAELILCDYKKHGPYKTTTFRRTQVDLKTYTHVHPKIYSTQKSTVLSKIKSDDLKVVKWKNQL